MPLFSAAPHWSTSTCGTSVRGSLSHGGDESGSVVVVVVEVVVVAIVVVEDDVVLDVADSGATPHAANRIATVKNAINLRIEFPFLRQVRGWTPAGRAISSLET